MDDLIARLEDDPAVRAFVDEALGRADGDPERAVRLMQLRLARARPEDGRVFAAVVAEALALAAAERPRAPTLGERVARLCECSRACWPGAPRSGR